MTRLDTIKFLRSTFTCLIVGSTAFVAATAPISPASAQGVPAGLLRLDPPRPWSEYEQIVRRPSGIPQDAYAFMGPADSYAFMGDDEVVVAARSFCGQRYGSHGPGTGTFLGYDGRRYRCP
jgi:BA14K-like protein